MKKLLSALYALYFFRPYTYHERWFEIGCGVIAWIQTAIIVFALVSCTPKSVNHYVESNKKVRGIFVGCDCVCIKDSLKAIQ